MADHQLPRELMESCLAEAQEATMQGFSESVLASAITPFVQKMMDTCYRMGFECGWRIREKAIANGVDDDYEKRMHEFMRSRGVPEQTIDKNIEIARAAIAAATGENRHE